MSIWRTQTSVEQLHQFSRETLAETIGIRVTEIGPDYLRATMPVNPRVHQPMGVLHGGASVALAETLGSVAASLCIDPAKSRCVGLEINANHLRSVSDGFVYGVARPVHVGARSHVWEIRISDPQQRPVCISRITMFILDHPAQ